LRKSGINKQEGQSLEFPASLEYLWVWFCELTFTDFSPVQIQAFFALEQVDVKPWELDLLKTLNREWKKALNSGSS